VDTSGDNNQRPDQADEADVVGQRFFGAVTISKAQEVRGDDDEPEADGYLGIMIFPPLPLKEESERNARKKKDEGKDEPGIWIGRAGLHCRQGGGLEDFHRWVEILGAGWEKRT